MNDAQEVEINETSANRYTVPSVRTAVSILRFLKRKGHRKSSLAEICKELGVSKSSAFTVLKTLQDAEFVNYHEADKKYSLGLALLELGGVVADEMDDVAIARPFVHDLVNQTQETCIIVKWINRHFVVLHCEEPRRNVRVTIAVGERFRHIASAFGKAYLAFASGDYVRQLINEASHMSLAYSMITDIRKFQEDLVVCRQRGYAESFEEAILGINAVAAPVFDKSGNVALIIGTLGFSSSLSPESMRRDGALIREAAMKVSAALGGLNVLSQLETSSDAVALATEP